VASVWEPLWQAVNEVNLPLHFHTFPSTSGRARDKATGLASGPPSSRASPASR
jgi:hypothetical protein